MIKIPKEFFKTLPFFAFVMLAFILQLKLPFAGDVGYLIHVSQQLFSGGKYGQEIFETNPPMILYLYSPILIFIKLGFQNIALITETYVFFLIALSTSTSYLLLKKTYHNKYFSYFIFMILYVLCILPTKELGQREHLLFILILPYLFSTVNFLEDKPSAPFFRFLIALLAGLGFSLKPFFLVTPLLIESYVIYAQKNIWSWLRIEPITLIVLLGCYFASILFFQPDYITTLLPLISDFYFYGTMSAWLDIFVQPLVIFCIASCFIYLFLRKNIHNHLTDILWLTTAGMILAFIIPRSPWYYHLFPALGFSCLLVTNYLSILFADNMNKQSLRIPTDVLFLTFLFVILFIPFYNNFLLTRYFIHQKKEGPNTKLIAYFSKLHQQQLSISCFSANTTADCFPLVYQDHAIYASRYPFFWWIRGVLKKEHYPLKTSLPDKMEKEKKLLIENVAADLIKYKTRFIIVNDSDKTACIDKEFSYIAYFAKNKDFSKAWKNYRYLGHISYYDIYERKGEKHAV